MADSLAELLGTGAGVVTGSAGAEQPTRATVAAVAAVNASGLTNLVMKIFMKGAPARDDERSLSL